MLKRPETCILHCMCCKDDCPCSMAVKGCCYCSMKDCPNQPEDISQYKLNSCNSDKYKASYRDEDGVRHEFVYNPNTREITKINKSK